jgi:transcriptional regulator with XRE-family HTH domain
MEVEMYRNLEAEMKRKGISRKQFADLLGININTVSAKLTGKSPLLWNEVLLIADILFNGEFEPKYLFAKSAG